MEPISSVRRWFTMLALCLSGGLIYLLPYFRELYSEPMRAALGFSQTQLGLVASALGVTNMICYLPGGWLADRFSARRLLTFSMVTTGLIGFYFATFPGFVPSMVVHVLWGLCSVFTYWAALIKATREWAPPMEQGRAFGILEAGRGISRGVFSAGAVALLAFVSERFDEVTALAAVVVALSVSCVAVGALTWVLVPDRADSGERASGVGLRELLGVLRIPGVWLLAVIIVTAYTAYLVAFYLPGYATEVFEMSTVFGASLGVAKMWVAPLCCVAAGFLADRFSASRIIAAFFLLLGITGGAFAVMPGGASLAWLLVLNTVAMAAAIYALRGVYFAVMEEASVPQHVTGTATGTVSVIGYTPDVFMPVVGGVILDARPGGAGYRLIFGVMAGACALGLAAAMAVRPLSRKKT